MKALHIEFDGSEYKVFVLGRPVSAHSTYGDAERDMFGRMKMSCFSEMPAKGGMPVTGPIQIYEDRFPLS